MREPDHLIVVGVALASDHGDAQGNGFGIVCHGFAALQPPDDFFRCKFCFQLGRPIIRRQDASG